MIAKTMHDENKNFDMSLSLQECKSFGIDVSKIKIYETSEELKKQTPALVIAECLQNITFFQNNEFKQTINKKQVYIMSLSIYTQLRQHPKNGSKILRPIGKKFSNIYRPYRGEDLTEKILLVSRTGGFGDLLFIQPNLIYLKKKYPTCKIMFSCSPQYLPMVETWDCIDKIINLPATIQSFALAHYHAIFEGVIERNKEAEKVNAYNLFSRWLGLDLSNELLVPKQNPNKEKVEEVKQILSKNNLELDKFILIQPRASSPIRTPRPKFWQDLMMKLIDKGFKIILTDTSKKKNVINQFFIEPMEEKYKNNIFNFAEYSISMDYTIALAYLSKLCIATDSSLIHIAASMDKKTYGIFGPFPGEVRVSTYPKCDFINGTCPKSPCFIHGQKPCPMSDSNGYSICYDSINLDIVANKIEILYNEE
jgi:ADP-heptose:LPS heptosyltransferase